MGGRYCSESTALGLKEQSECVQVSFDISNIHVVVAERCCKGESHRPYKTLEYNDGGLWTTLAELVIRLTLQ